jgi:hypothetical protein
VAQVVDRVFAYKVQSRVQTPLPPKKPTNQPNKQKQSTENWKSILSLQY